MRRFLSGSLAAIDALALVAIGYGLLLVPALIVWAVQFGFTVDPVGFAKLSASLWLLGHGVDITVIVDPVLSASLGLGPTPDPVRLSIALLGIGLLNVQLGLRAGRRAALADDPNVSLVVATAVTAALAGVMVVLSGSTVSLPSRPQGVLLPTAVVATSMVIGCVLEQRRRGESPLLEELARRVRWYRLDTIAQRDLGASLAGGLKVAAGVLTVAGLALAVSIALSYASVVGVYQSLQGGLLGGTIVTALQLIALPNLVVWAASWITGAGFAIGTGTAVSPAGTLLGPVPGLPLLAAVPQPAGQWGLAVVLIPLLMAFVVSMMIRQRHDKYSSPARLNVLLSISAGMATVAAGTLALLAWWSGGAIGPGRMAQVGPNPMLVFACTFGLVFVGAFVGGAAGRATVNK